MFLGDGGHGYLKEKTWWLGIALSIEIVQLVLFLMHRLTLRMFSLSDFGRSD